MLIYLRYSQVDELKASGLLLMQASGNNDSDQTFFSVHTKEN